VEIAPFQAIPEGNFFHSVRIHFYYKVSCFLTLCREQKGLREASALRRRIVFSSGGAGDVIEDVINLTTPDVCRRDFVLKAILE
jgi:hypothetical protein